MAALPGRLQQGALHRPDPHGPSDQRGVEGLRLLEVRAGGRPGDGPAVHLRQGRLRGHPLHVRDGSARHAARPAGALGARVPGDRRAAGDLRAAAAGRDLDRARRSRRRPTTRSTVADIKACEKKNGRIPAGSVVMVRSDWSKKWTDDPDEGQGARRRPEVPGRQPAGARVPAPQAPHPVPRPRAAGHRQLARPRRRVVADAPRLHAGRGRRQPRRRAADRLPARRSATRSSRAASAATRATWRSARPTRQHGAKISSKDAPLRAQVEDAALGHREGIPRALE